MIIRHIILSNKRGKEVERFLLIVVRSDTSRDGHRCGKIVQRSYDWVFNTIVGAKSARRDHLSNKYIPCEITCRSTRYAMFYWRKCATIFLDDLPRSTSPPHPSRDSASNHYHHHYQTRRQAPPGSLASLGQSFQFKVKYYGLNCIMVSFPKR